jgi:hypothetical protein
MIRKAKPTKINTITVAEELVVGGRLGIEAVLDDVGWGIGEELGVVIVAGALYIKVNVPTSGTSVALSKVYETV